MAGADQALYLRDNNRRGWASNTFPTYYRHGAVQPRTWLKAAQSKKESDVEMATAQMERALRADGWL